jgi:hypothetical protein
MYVTSPVQYSSTPGGWELSAAFARQAPAPPLQSVDDASAGSVNLDDLSQKVHCSDFYADVNGQVQDDHFVTSARSFDSQRDYYYVQDFPKVISYRTAPAVYASSSQPFVQPPDTRELPLTGTRILFSQPSTTTQYVSEYTNNRSTSVSGTVGFQGITPNISATVSVTVGTSTTVTVPPVTIQNISNLAAASTGWKFIPASPLTNVLYDTAESWTWTIDRDVYGATPNEIPEVHIYTDAGTNYTHTPGRCAFPPPFRTFDVTASMDHERRTGNGAERWRHLPDPWRANVSGNCYECSAGWGRPSHIEFCAYQRHGNQGRGTEQPEDRYECSSGKYVLQWDCSDIEHQREGEREIAVA